MRLYREATARKASRRSHLAKERFDRYDQGRELDQIDFDFQFYRKHLWIAPRDGTGARTDEGCGVFVLRPSWR